MTDIPRRTAIATILAAPLALSVSRARAASHAAAHEVMIQGFAFSPAELEVAAGDTVSFTNADNAPYTATAMDGSFDTGRLNGGESGTITVAEAGTHEFKCNFHPAMRGTITAT